MTDRAFFAHPQALVESEDIGEKTRIWAFAQVMKGATIGVGCNIGGQCFIEAGARIGNGVTVKNGVSVWDCVELEDDVFVGPSAVFTNHPSPRAFIKEGKKRFLPTHVRKGATLGAGATIVCGNEIGEYAFVAAGAVVTRPVPAHALVAGNPARLLSWVCTCSRKKVKPTADLSAEACEECGFRFEKIKKES